jgi:hypothetical protein
MAVISYFVTRIEAVEPGLTGIGTVPAFAINQRALLAQIPEGNLLWDCITLIDEATVAAVRALGGIRAIAISYPHYYTTMIEWAQTFGATIYLHADDRAHVMRPDPAITFWEGETLQLFGGLTLIRCGGHFAGAQVLHWLAGADGRGALLTGDIIMVTQDRRYVQDGRHCPSPSGKPRALIEYASTGSFAGLWPARYCFVMRRTKPHCITKRIRYRRSRVKYSTPPVSFLLRRIHPTDSFHWYDG